jgi:hypothetical protein
MVPKDSVIEAASAAGTIITYKVIVTDNVDSSLLPCIGLYLPNWKY